MSQPILVANPAELKFTFATGHVLASSILVDVYFAFGTG